MKYIVEQKKLESLLDKEIWELFATHNAIVAGGAITSLFCSRDINDIDAYFRSEKDLVKVLAAIYGEDEIFEEEIDRFQMHVSGLSQRTIICTNKDQMVQLMTFKYFPEVQDIFDTFDFTCCMGAYDCKSQEFTFHPDFFKHNSQRYLKFNTGTAYPLMSLMRVDKYREKGYSISKAELLRVIFACMELNINSWDAAKEHIGGMYGYDMSKAFEEDKEFSIIELSEQLSTLQKRGTELYTPINQENVSFWDICEELFYDPDAQVDHPTTITFDDNKYLYKCVTKDGYGYCVNPESFYTGYKPVLYEAGSIIEVPSGGLFFHKSSKQTYVSDRYWVECEVLDGEIQNLSNQKKVVTGGKIKVVRAFEYDVEFGKNKVRDYILQNYGYQEEDNE